MAMKSAHRLDDKSKIRTSDVTESTAKRSFSDLHLKPMLIRGLHGAGYLNPSPVQWSALPLANLGVDLVVQAKSGTGKTLVFVVSALNMVNLDVNNVQVILLAPTREIAVQGARACLDVAKGAELEELKVHTFIGGMAVSDDLVKVKKCHVAVGTPGRIRQLMNGGHLKKDSIRLFVLDEADKLMEDSFRADINWIFNQLPESKQVIALSATYPGELEQLVSKFMSNPQHVRLNPKSQVLVGVSQFAMLSPSHPQPHVEADLKYKILLQILNSTTFSQCLIFSNYAIRAESICEKLEANGWPVLYLAGTMHQQDRLRALNSLKQYNCRVLLTTDLSARGIDAANVNLVINMEVPWEPATYLHRIGRSGRFGSYGIAITIANDSSELKSLQEIVHETGSNIALLDNTEDIPDLWKAKQNNELDAIMEKLKLVEAKEPTAKKSVDQKKSSENGLGSIFLLENKTGKTKKRGKKKKAAEEESPSEPANVMSGEVYEANLPGAWQTVPDHVQEVEDFEPDPDSYFYHDYAQGVDNQYYYSECNQDNYAYDYQVEDTRRDITEEEPVEISDSFLIEAFEKAVGYKVQIKAEDEFDLENRAKVELENLFEKLKIHRGQETDPKFDELCKTVMNHEKGQWKQKVDKTLEILKNKSVSEAIAELETTGSLTIPEPEMEQSVKPEGIDKEEHTGLLPPWQPVEPGESSDFKGENILLGVELDEDYFLEAEAIAPEPVPDYFDFGQTGRESADVTWNPFPDPDDGLPVDLRFLHRNEWLKQQYLMWLNKVEQNRLLIEQHEYAKRRPK